MGQVHYLVTGGAGFVGSHLSDALVDRGHSVTVLDDLSTGRMENIAPLLESDRFEFVEGSALDAPLVDELMAAADGCFHLASAVGVKLIMEQTLDSALGMIRGNDIVIGAAARHGARLLFTSTSEVYGKNGRDVLDEGCDRVLGSVSSPRWAYATAKLVGEMLALEYVNEHAASMVVGRVFNTVGPRQSDAYGMVLPRFVRQALAGEDLTVFGSGRQSRCFIHVADTVEALIRLIEHEEAAGRVFNVGSHREITIRALAEQVIERTGSASGIRLVPYEEAYGIGFEELRRGRPDCSALQALTGWAPSRTLEQTIDEVIGYEREARSAGSLSLPGP